MQRFQLFKLYIKKTGFIFTVTGPAKTLGRVAVKATQPPTVPQALPGMLSFMKI